MEDRDLFDRIFLAGVGALALSGEKAKELLGELVKKGEMTVEQGKALNEELKRNRQDAAKNARMESLIDQIGKLDKEEVAALRAKIEELQKDGE